MLSTYLISEVRAYREALEMALCSSGRVDVVGRAAHPIEALSDRFVRDAQVALMDAALGDGVRWARELMAKCPRGRVVIVGLEEAEQEVTAWAEAGVAGYVGRDATLADVIATIERAARERTPCPTRTVSILLGRAAEEAERPSSEGPLDRPHLTPRQLEIIWLIGQGLTNEQIGLKLFIALPTVKNHIHNILERLGVHRRGDAVRQIRHSGLFLDSRHRDPSRRRAGNRWLAAQGFSARSASRDRSVTTIEPRDNRTVPWRSSFFSTRLTVGRVTPASPATSSCVSGMTISSSPRS